jgi:hypothetical protein
LPLRVASTTISLSTAEVSAQPTLTRQSLEEKHGPSVVLDDRQEVHVGSSEVEIPLSRVAVGTLEVRLEAIGLDEEQARSEGEVSLGQLRAC